MNAVVKEVKRNQSAGTGFKAAIEEWELEKDKRVRRGQGWRMRFKYIGLVLDDKEQDGHRRVIGVKWHSDRNSGDAGWGVGNATSCVTYESNPVPSSHIYCG